jgi:hypothetical protein
MPKKKPPTEIELLTEKYSGLSDRALLIALLDRVIEIEKGIDQIIDEMPNAEILKDAADAVGAAVEVANYEEIERKLDNLDFYLRNKS